MRVYALTVLRVHGIWPSCDWINPWKLMYKCYTCYVIFLLFILFMGQLFYLVLKAKNMYDILINCPIFILTIEGITKLHNFITKKNQLDDIINKISIDNIKLRDHKENKIYRKYQKYLRSAALSLTTFYVSFCGITFIKSLLDNTLVVKVWIPQWIETFIPSWIIYMIFLISSWFGTLILLSCKLVHVQILIQTSMHLDILNHRFSIILMNNKQKIHDYLIDCILYQLHVYKLADNIQKVFLIPITVEICSFGAKLCVSVIVLTSVDVFSIRGFIAMSYVSGSFCINFLHFWEANNVTLKSTAIGNSLYKMNWINAKKLTANIIMIVMNYSMMRPIIFTGILLIPMSNTTFTTILKASYQTYCVLHTIVMKSAIN